MEAFSSRVGEKLSVFLGDAELLDHDLQIDMSAGYSTWIPWEWLTNSSGEPISVGALRRTVNDLPLRKFNNGPLRVLLALCRPFDSPDLPLRKTVDAMRRAVGSVVDVELKILYPASLEKLVEWLDDRGPFDVVHFDGHGVSGDINGSGALVFDDNGKSQPVPMKKIASAVDRFKVPLVVLNSCRSGATWRGGGGESFAAGLAREASCFVVAMKYSVYPDTVARFASFFYRRLATKLSPSEALSSTIDAMRKEAAEIISPTVNYAGFQDWRVPVAFVGADVQHGDARRGFSFESAQLDPALNPSIELDGYLRLAHTKLDNFGIVFLVGLRGVGKQRVAEESIRWRNSIGNGGLRTAQIDIGYRNLDAVEVINQVLGLSFDSDVSENLGAVVSVFELEYDVVIFDGLDLESWDSIWGELIEKLRRSRVDVYVISRRVPPEEGCAEYIFVTDIGMTWLKEEMKRISPRCAEMDDGELDELCELSEGHYVAATTIATIVESGSESQDIVRAFALGDKSVLPPVAAAILGEASVTSLSRSKVVSFLGQFRGWFHAEYLAEMVFRYESLRTLLDGKAEGDVAPLLGFTKRMEAIGKDRAIVKLGLGGIFDQLNDDGWVFSKHWPTFRLHPLLRFGLPESRDSGEEKLLNWVYVEGIGSLASFLMQGERDGFRPGVELELRNCERALFLAIELSNFIAADQILILMVKFIRQRSGFDLENLLGRVLNALNRVEKSGQMGDRPVRIGETEELQVTAWYMLRLEAAESICIHVAGSKKLYEAASRLLRIAFEVRRECPLIWKEKGFLNRVGYALAIAGVTLQKVGHPGRASRIMGVSRRIAGDREIVKHCWGIYLQNEGHLDQAIGVFEDEYKREGSRVSIATLYHLGKVYNMKGDLASGLFYHSECQSRCGEMENRTTLFDSLHDMALAYSKSGQYVDARRVFGECVDLMTAYFFPGDRRAAVLYEYGIALAECGCLDDAEEVFKDVIGTVQRIDFPEDVLSWRAESWVRRASYELALVYKNRGQLQESFSILESLMSEDGVSDKPEFRREMEFVFAEVRGLQGDIEYMEMVAVGFEDDEMAEGKVYGLRLKAIAAMLKGDNVTYISRLRELLRLFRNNPTRRREHLRVAIDISRTMLEENMVEGVERLLEEAEGLSQELGKKDDSETIAALGRILADARSD